jgi:hypothetical protein
MLQAASHLEYSFRRKQEVRAIAATAASIALYRCREHLDVYSIAWWEASRAAMSSKRPRHEGRLPRKNS